MKLKYIIATLLAGATLFCACENEADHYLSEVKVEKSFVSFPAAGGDVAFKFTTTDSWDLKNLPDWITSSKNTGAAGENTVTLTATAATETREATFNIVCAGQTQNINAIQMTEKVERQVTSMADIVAAGSGTFRAKGTVTKITSTSYGNWYFNDGTVGADVNGGMGIQVYGTLNKKGNTYDKNNAAMENLNCPANPDAWEFSVGDIITVEGPLTLYNTTWELVDVTVIEIERSLIKVNSTELLGGEEPVATSAFPLEGGNIKVNLDVKGDGFHVSIPEAAKSWLHIEDFSATSVTLRADANGGGDRSAEVTFSTEKGGVTYTCVQAFTQKGAIIPISCAGLNALADGDALYRVKGVITSIVMDKNDATKYNKYGNFHIVDETGDVYVYGLLDGPGGAAAKDVLTTMGAKVGDVITVVGPKGSHNNSPQMVNAYCEAYVPVTAKTCAEFNALADGNDLYLVSGKITEIVMDKTDATRYNKYGNFYVQDDSGEKVYVYGLVTTMESKSAQDILTTLGVKVGDIITVVGPKASHNNAAQMKNAFYVSHEIPVPDNVVKINFKQWGADNQWTDATNYVTIESGVVKLTASWVGDNANGIWYVGNDTAPSDWRFYQARQGGMTLFIADGYCVKSVKFTYANKNGGYLKAPNGDKVETGVAYTASLPQSSLFTVASDSATNGQARIQEIEVEYDVLPE